jgi:zinc/manganese transport system ATP-binding protein
MPRPKPPAIVFEDLTLGYDRHPAVHHLSGRIPPGALLAIVGPNGAGKSTLLKGLIGELKPMGGRIRHEVAAGDPSPRTSAARTTFAYVPQKDRIDLSYPVSVFDLVAMGLWEQRGLFGGFGRRDDKRVGDALRRVGLNGFERRAVGTLSGGQLQRALFARVSLQDAPFILLDEPFSAIDNPTIADLMVVVRAWSAEGRTVIAVLHDFALVRAHFPEALLLAREAIAWGPTETALSPRHLDRARAMTEAFDDTAPFCEAGGGHAHSHGAGAEHDHDHAPHAPHDHAHHHHAHDHPPAKPGPRP